MESGDWQLWVYPEPLIIGEPKLVKRRGKELVPMREVAKKHKLPPAVRRCVVDVYNKRGEKTREGLSRAFAICIAAQQKAGQMKGSKLTKKGKKKSKSYGKKDMKPKDAEYERVLAQFKKEGTDEGYLGNPAKDAVKDIKHRAEKTKGTGKVSTDGLFPGKKKRDKDREKTKKKLDNIRKVLAGAEKIRGSST